MTTIFIFNNFLINTIFIYLKRKFLIFIQKIIVLLLLFLLFFVLASYSTLYVIIYKQNQKIIPDMGFEPMFAFTN